jgi:RNA-directed DNA polymerase
VSAADKPFSIDKKLVYEAYKAVRANAGAAGVDGQTIEQFEAELGDNLYKLWNRMSSGSYFPPPVRAVAIPKKEWRAKASRGANRCRSCGADGGQADD